MTKRDEEIYEEPGPKLTVVKLSEEERRGLSTNGAQLKRADKNPGNQQLATKKIYINLDVMFLYLVLLVGLIVMAIKAIRWAVTS